MFRYYNWWSQIEGYSEKVQVSWTEPVVGSSMYVIVQKLKRLKKTLYEIKKGKLSKLRDS